ncbi:hypothetical protein BN946_scf184943.g11 [Trametes cinnabarina]|uniref:DUF6534 domain-containing protein n=1 Tax=Pycnoporus cinnabarinus TaxID=5643 RepID=A0A060SBT7_PYCCI|nr:hypothetical protein BN946_scf184943.g11 [Trametes cinnabarina]
MPLAPKIQDFKSLNLSVGSLDAALGFPALDNTMGALFLGTTFGLMLYGLTMYQSYLYFRLYKNDHLWLKCLVLAIFILETFHITLCIIALYHDLITNYLKPLSLLSGHWSTRVKLTTRYAPYIVTDIDAGTACSSSLRRLELRCCFVKGAYVMKTYQGRGSLSLFQTISFYAYRVLRVGTHHFYLVSVIVAALGMLCQLGFAISAGRSTMTSYVQITAGAGSLWIAATIEGFRLSLSDFHHVSWMISGWCGSAMLVDALLSGTLVTALLKSRTGFKRTDSLIEVLIVYAINTGVLTSVFGVLIFTFAIVLPGNLIYIAFTIVGVKPTEHSRAAARLNSRKSLSDRMQQGFEMGSESLSKGPRRHPRDTGVGTIGTWQVGERTTNVLEFAVASSGFSESAPGSSNVDLADKPGADGVAV